jgi:hypothetical protein
MMNLTRARSSRIPNSKLISPGKIPLATLKLKTTITQMRKCSLSFSNHILKL